MKAKTINHNSTRKLINSTRYDKILPANKMNKNNVITRPITSGGINRNYKDNYNSNSINDMSNYQSQSPNKKTSYIESLKDKIFSPGDFEPNKNESKHTSLIVELTKTFFNNSPLSTKSEDNLPKNKIVSPLIYLPNKPYNHLSRKTLFLDLDETLVHSAFKPFYVQSDIVLNITYDQKNHTIHILKRPYVDEFLDKMSKIFELVIFTASIPEYANPLLNKLDLNKRITSRLFREHCTASNNLFIKDLKKVGRHIKDSILLDNNPVSYALNKENGLPILTWHSNKNDTELLKLIPLLEYLSKTEDVRIPIQKVVSNNYVNYFEVNRLINQKDNDKTNQTNNSINTLNYSINNGMSSNYSMNLSSYNFSPFFFDDKDKKVSVKEKDKNKDNDNDNNIDLFSNFFENKKGTGSLFNDKKYKEKYDQFYDIKEKNNSTNIFRKTIKKEIVTPSNDYHKKEDFIKSAIQVNQNIRGDLNHNGSSINIQRSSESVLSFGKASSSRLDDFYNIPSPKSVVDPDYGIMKNDILSKSITRKNNDFYNDKRNTGESAGLNNFFEKTTVSLQDQSQNNRLTFNQLPNWDLNVHRYKSNLVGDSNRNQIKVNINKNNNRNSSQTLRERLNKNNMSDFMLY